MPEGIACGSSAIDTIFHKSDASSSFPFLEHNDFVVYGRGWWNFR